jgi:hypothetical protein
LFVEKNSSATQNYVRKGFMAESVTRSEKDHQEQVHAAVQAAVVEKNIQAPAASMDEHASIVSPAPVIWTPRFIVLFFLVCVTGLSLASILTQSWLNGYFAGFWVLLAFTALNFGGWFALALAARTSWARIGAIFGCAWSVFEAISFLMSLLAVNPQAPIIAHLNAATNSALLGCYVALSINRTAFRRWDSWFFRIAFVLGAIAIPLIYLLVPADIRELYLLETITAAVELYLCIFVWWLRPSCWQAQPLPTFLFGIAPVILLLLALPDFADKEANFFFSQIVLLCILLAVIRTLQGEYRYSQSKRGVK